VSLAALYHTQNLENNEELDCILKVYLGVSKINKSCTDCLPAEYRLNTNRGFKTLLSFMLGVSGDLEG